MNEIQIVDESKFKVIVNRIWKALHNTTFLYILKRVLRSLLTALLIVVVIIALVRLVPETRLYDIKQYQKLYNSGNQIAAEQFKIQQLYIAGRVDKNGTPITVLESVLKYLYYIFPIYKEIPISWTVDKNPIEPLKYWKGYIYFGRSINQNDNVEVLFIQKCGISFKISLWTLLFGYLIGYPLGIAMAKKPGGVVDKIGNAFIVLNYAIPALVFYLFMKDVFGDFNYEVTIDGVTSLVYPFGYRYDKDNVFSLIPPIFCMVFLSIPGVIIYLRRFMIDELSSDYVKFARAKGLSENRIMYTHVLRNAIVPLVRNIPATFIFSIVGSYFVEKIWNINGTGKMLTDAIRQNDFPVVQGLTLIFALMSMLAFLLGDIITVFFDPRIKLQND